MAHFSANFRLIALLFTENDRKIGLNSPIFRYGFYSRTASWARASRPLASFPFYLHAVVGAESRSVTPLHDLFDKSFVYASLLLQHGQHSGSENLLERLQIYTRHNIKDTTLTKQAIGKQYMDMRMPSAIIAEGMDDHYHGRHTVIKLQGRAKKENQALIHALAQFAEQLSVVSEKMAEYNGD